MIRFEHREEKWIFPFVEYSPSDKNGIKLPLIIQLHGAGERGNGQDDLRLVDAYGFTKSAMEYDEDFLLIAPQCPSDTFWAAHVESLIKFIGQIKEAYDIDESRIYLTGISMGGFGTWFTAMARPDLFAAIAPVCGGGMAWNAGVLTMPVWAFHGDADEVVSVRHTEEMAEAMKNAGLDITYTKYPGVGHNAWDFAYTPDLLHWLLSKTKK